MAYDRRGRHSYALAGMQPYIATKLKWPLLAILPAWIAYFFAVTFFGPSLDRIVVPYVNLPLGGQLAILGCALAFPILIYVMSRGFVATRRS
jgi:hypothetical protein